ncbi:hypothetical protein [Streptomyces sp. R41]|uniref:SAV-6107-like HEPN domain-containing protein n=1 Tax=Streptomyces sp. R41 TaxID=3238632 RepID=A0AB39RJB8_9ACTN
MKGRVGGPEAAGAAPASGKAMTGEGAAGRGGEPGRPGPGIPPEERADTPARETPARVTPARVTPARETPVRETPAREPVSGGRGPDRPGTVGRPGESARARGFERDRPGATPGEAVGAVRGRESAAAPRPAGDATATGGVGTPGRTPAPHDSRLLPQDECDKFSLRLRHAFGGFVDGPRDAVEEADHLLEELAERFTEAVTHRRRTLRTSWQSGDKATPTTEDLRLALRDYREMTERLLRL